MAQTDRFIVDYSITAENNAEARARAWDICVEQTIEFPYALVKNKFIKKEIVGRIESLKQSGRKRFLASISYSEDTAGFEFTQFLNVLFGNSSIKPDIRVEKITLSQGLRRLFKGPRFGLVGLRKLLKAQDRPLICSALKPMGLSSKELANLAYKFALGGIDVIKDDHGLSNQRWAPFEKRVELCARAVAKANKETGGNTLYAPNVTAGCRDVFKRAKFAKQAGAGAIVISPGLAGFDALRSISLDASICLPILMHPAFLGSFTASPASGISHFALYGQISRLAGADISVFPNFNGRFSFSKEECAGIADGCRVKMNGIKPVFPGPGGGITLNNVKNLKKFYGNDVIFLMGGGLFASGKDLTGSVRAFKRLVTGS